MSLIHIGNSNTSKNTTNALTLHQKGNSLAPILLGPQHSRFTLLSSTSTKNPPEMISCCFSAKSGRFIATADIEGKVCLWTLVVQQQQVNNNNNNNEDDATANIETQQEDTTIPQHPHCLASYKMKAPVTRLKFGGPTGEEYIFCALANGHASIIDLEAGKVLPQTFAAPNNNNNNKESGSSSKKKSVFENAIVINDIAVAENTNSSSSTTTNANNNNNSTKISFATCHDDGRVCLWQGSSSVTASSSKFSVRVFSAGIPQTCVCFGGRSSSASGGGADLFCAGVDGCLRWLQPDPNNSNELKCVVECDDAFDENDIVSGIATINNNSNNRSHSSQKSSSSCVLSCSLNGRICIHDLRPWDESNNSKQQQQQHLLFEDDLRTSAFGLSSKDNQHEDAALLANQIQDSTLLRCSFSPNGNTLAVASPNGAGVVVYQNIQQFLAGGSSSSSEPSKKDYFKDNRFFIQPSGSKRGSSATITDVGFHPRGDDVGETVLVTSSLDGSCVVAAI